mgnify:CR=1 FL=1
MNAEQFAAWVASVQDFMGRVSAQMDHDAVKYAEAMKRDAERLAADNTERMADKEAYAKRAEEAHAMHVASVACSEREAAALEDIAISLRLLARREP